MKRRLNKLVATLTLLILILVAPSNLVRANDMYYYDKYTLSAEYHKIDRRAVRYVGPQYEEDTKSYLMPSHTSSFQQQKKILDEDFEYYPHYALDRNTGYYGLGEKIIRRKAQSPIVGYYFFVSIKGENGWSSANKIIQDSYIHEGQKGTYIETVKDYNGTYPLNGKHNDGYWYVRMGLANIKPTIIVDKPGSNQTIGAKGVLSISGVVTDPDVGILTIKATIGGRQKSITKSTPTTNSTWQLTWTGEELAEGKYPTIPISVNDGQDTSTAYHTGTKIVDKTKPTMLLEVME